MTVQPQCACRTTETHGSHIPEEEEEEKKMPMMPSLRFPSAVNELFLCRRSVAIMSAFRLVTSQTDSWGESKMDSYLRQMGSRKTSFLNIL